MKTVGLFAGIGGIEEGFRRAGFDTATLVEIAPHARAVLAARFPEAQILEDVCTLKKLPEDTSVLTAGFPCQDVSSVGRKSGASGGRTSLVSHVMRLVRTNPVPWVVLENVPFIRHLAKGEVLGGVVNELEELGYSWAYRILDTQAFGLPQRRRRWFLVASNEFDPASVLHVGDVQPPEDADEAACGFYWTEGMRALGWAHDAVPPLKCGSTIGVPSPPAIAMRDGRFVTPELRDAERLQGFPAEWTAAATTAARDSMRWQLIGNAVSVPVAEWVAGRIAAVSAGEEVVPVAPAGTLDGRWPNAAVGGPDRARQRVEVGTNPIWCERPSLETFLEYTPKPLSVRAANGFMRRAARGSLRFPEGFLPSLERYVEAQEQVSGAAK